MTDLSQSVSKSSGLRVDGVSLWRGERRLFQNLSFELHPGELMHLTGPNGVGKTSLLRVICGLTLPEDGAVYWNGQDTRRHRDNFLPDLSYVGHREGLKDELTAVENLKAGLALRDVAFDPQVLTQVGLGDCDDIPVGHLSAGQRRRVTLARVIAANTRLWILDEPFSNLDTAGHKFLQDKILEHSRTGGLVLFTAHQEIPFDGTRPRSLELSP